MPPTIHRDCHMSEVEQDFEVDEHGRKPCRCIVGPATLVAYRHEPDCDHRRSLVDLRRARQLGIA